MVNDGLFGKAMRWAIKKTTHSLAARQPVNASPSDYQSGKAQNSKFARNSIWRGPGLALNGQLLVMTVECPKAVFRMFAFGAPQTG